MSKYIRTYETLCPADKISSDDPRRDQIIAEMRAVHRAKTDEAAAEAIAWWGEWPNPRHATALEFVQEARKRLSLNGPAGGGQNTGSSGAAPLSPDRAV